MRIIRIALMVLGFLAVLFVFTLCDTGEGTGGLTVLGWNDLGMHCMNEDFSEIAILPPFNNFNALVIRQGGEEPRIVTQGVTLTYDIPGNTTSSDKTNFWTYANALYGMSPADNIGLTGNGLAGAMTLASGKQYWHVDGVPITPLTDVGDLNPYQLSSVYVAEGGVQVATTQNVMPVSWEISCNLCHTGGTSPANDILVKHDTLHQAAYPNPSVALADTTPVLCAACHLQKPLEPYGFTGVSGVPTLSQAMHASHATRFSNPAVLDPAVLADDLRGVTCYACHPGINTQCFRDVHKPNGLVCASCHGEMDAVGNSGREPWVTEPRCGTCHTKAGYEFEQANTLYRESRGHNGVYCAACHGSPHAITPSMVAADNIQSVTLQGQAGPIGKYKCTMCHGSRPDDPFNHTLGGD